MGGSSDNLCLAVVKPMQKTDPSYLKYTYVTCHRDVIARVPFAVNTYINDNYFRALFLLHYHCLFKEVIDLQSRSWNQNTLLIYLFIRVL